MPISSIIKENLTKCPGCNGPIFYTKIPHINSDIEHDFACIKKPTEFNLNILNEDTNSIILLCKYLCTIYLQKKKKKYC